MLLGRVFIFKIYRLLASAAEVSENTPTFVFSHVQKHLTMLRSLSKSASGFCVFQVQKYLNTLCSSSKL